MSQNSSPHQADGKANAKGNKDAVTNHLVVAGVLIGTFFNLCWVVPSISDNWDHWWMKLLVVLFGPCLSYGAYAFLHQVIKMSHKAALVFAVAFLVLYLALCFLALNGGNMPSFPVGISRFLLPLLFTLLTALAWYQAFHPRKSPVTPAPPKAAVVVTPKPDEARFCEREDWEKVQTLSEFIDTIHIHCRQLDKMFMRWDEPHFRAGIYAAYAVKTAKRLGVAVPQPVPDQSTLTSQDVKWYESLAEAARSKIIEMSTPTA